MQRHECWAGCGKLIPLALVLCWDCYSQVQKSVRKDFEAARIQLQRAPGAKGNLEIYRMHRATVVHEATKARDLKRKVAA